MIGVTLLFVHFEVGVSLVGVASDPNLFFRLELYCFPFNCVTPSNTNQNSNRNTIKLNWSKYLENHW